MIGVYDSGIGCITVLGPLLKELPNYNFYCLVDYKNGPYGEKKKEVLEEIIIKNVANLVEKGCDIIVIACNTASTFVSTLRKKFEIPIIAIEPAIKMVNDLKKNEKALVLATSYTIQSEKFRNLLDQLKKEQFLLFPCPNLATFIEEEKKERIKAYLKENFTPYKDIKHIVLGCTHYPLIKKELQAFFKKASFYDGGVGVAKQTKRILMERKKKGDKENCKITFSFTDGINHQEKFLEALDTYLKEC